jgi:hypothetical protein
MHLKVAQLGSMSARQMALVSEEYLQPGMPSSHKAHLQPRVHLLCRLCCCCRLELAAPGAQQPPLQLRQQGQLERGQPLRQRRARSCSSLQRIGRMAGMVMLSQCQCDNLAIAVPLSQQAAPALVTPLC